MTLVQRLRRKGGPCKKPNLYDDAADRINHLETALNEIANCKFCAGTHSWRVARAAVRYARFEHTSKIEGKP